MYYHQGRLIVPLSFLVATSEAFCFINNNPSVNRPYGRLIAMDTNNRPTCGRNPNYPTILQAAEEASEETPEEKETPKETSSNDSGIGELDILNSPAFLKRKLEVIKSDITKAEEEIASTKTTLEEGKTIWGDKLASLQKERANSQERMTKQSKEGEVSATVEVARNLLNVLDNFDRAFQSVTPETDDEKKVEESYKQAYAGILTTLKELGVNEVETVGKEFDYELHSAVMMRPSEDYEEGIVMDELQKGFVYGEVGMDEEGEPLGGQLIRAAMVAVAT